MVDNFASANKNNSKTFVCVQQTIGFGLYWAWLFLSVMNPFAISETAHVSPFISAEIAELLARAAALVAIIYLASSMYRKEIKRTLPWLAIIAGPTATLSLLYLQSAGLVTTYPIKIALWLLMGAVDASLIIIWLTNLRAVPSRRRGVSVALSFALGHALYLLIGLLPAALFIWAVAIIPIGSIVLYLFNRKKLTDSTEQNKRTVQTPNKSNDSLSIKLGRLWLAIAAFSATYGAVKALGTLTNPYTTTQIMAMAFIVTGAILALVVGILKPKRPFTVLYKLFLPVFTIGFLLGIIPGLERTNYSSAVILSAFLVFDVFSIVLVADLVEEIEFDWLKTFAISRLANTLGIIFGWLVVISIIQIGMPNIDTRIFVGGFFILLLVITTMLILSERTLLSIRSSGDTARKSNQSAQLSTDKTANNTESFDDGPGRWARACDEICEEYALSPREREVFDLLAKGRDNPYIADELVISTKTAKTHTYNIYKKIGIHSRQDAIDLVEKRRDEIDRKNC